MLQLTDRKWKDFVISALFDVSGTFTTHPDLLVNGGKTPRITCQATNNGLDNTYKNQPTEKGGTITIDSATIGYVSYHPYDYIATDHVEKLKLKQKHVNKYLGLFLVQAITFSSKNKYDYGYKFSQARIKRQKILLPITIGGLPDWDFMEQYVKERYQQLVAEYIEFVQARIIEQKIGGGGGVELTLNSREWKEFDFNEIFTEIQRGKRLKTADHKIGLMPYVSSSAINNGIDRFISNKNKVRIFENCLSIANSGSVGKTFFQPMKFVASDHVTKLKNAAFSKNVYLFIANIASRLSNKYNFNHEISDSRINREKLVLPITSDGQPDYIFMERYVAQIEIKQLKHYLQAVR